MNIEDYIITIDGKRWHLNKPTERRQGGFIPVDGYRKLHDKSVFVNIGQNQVNGVPFDELRNLASSSIGEIASKPSKTYEKGVIYHCFSFEKIIPVLRPCQDCIDKKLRNCTCDPLRVAITRDFEKILKERNGDLTIPLKLDPSRDFPVRICSSYATGTAFDVDNLTDDHSTGCFFRSEQIYIENGNVKTKNIKPGLLNSLKSAFNAKDSAKGSQDLPIEIQYDPETREQNDERTLTSSEFDTVIASGGDNNLGGSDKKVRFESESEISSDDNVDKLPLPVRRISRDNTPSPNLGSRETQEQPTGITKTASINMSTLVRTLPTASGILGQGNDAPDTQDDKHKNLYPAEKTDWCYLCEETRLFVRGRCSKCQVQYQDVPSQSVHGTWNHAERWVPPIPNDIINETFEKREQIARDSIFKQNEIEIDAAGVYQISAHASVGDELLTGANNVLKNRGYSNNLNRLKISFLDSNDPTLVLKTKYLLHVLLNNFTKERIRDYDKYFILDPKILNCVFSGDLVSLGPIVKNLPPIGLILAEFRNQIEKELAFGTVILKRIFDEKSCPDLGLRYVRSTMTYNRMGQNGWEEVPLPDLWDQTEVPFIRPINMGPRRFFLNKILSYCKSLAPDQRDENALPTDVLEKLRSEIELSREDDEDKVEQMESHTFLKDLEPIDGNYDSYELYYKKRYINHYGAQTDAKSLVQLQQQTLRPEENSRALDSTGRDQTKGAEATHGGSMYYDNFVPDLETSISNPRHTNQFNQLVFDENERLLKEGTRSREEQNQVWFQPYRKDNRPYKMSDTEKQDYKNLMGFEYQEGVEEVTWDNQNDADRGFIPFKEENNMINNVENTAKLLDMQNKGLDSESKPKVTSTPKPDLYKNVIRPKYSNNHAWTWDNNDLYAPHANHGAATNNSPGVTAPTAGGNPGGGGDPDDPGNRRGSDDSRNNRPPNRDPIHPFFGSLAGAGGGGGGDDRGGGGGGDDNDGPSGNGRSNGNNNNNNNNNNGNNNNNDRNGGNYNQPIRNNHPRHDVAQNTYGNDYYHRGSQREAELNRRLKLLDTKNPPVYSTKEGTSFRTFFSQFCFSYRYFCQMDNNELVYKFCCAFKEHDLRYQVQTIANTHPNIQLTQLAARVSAAIGVDSTEYYEVKLHNLIKKPGQNVGQYAFECLVTFNESINPKDFFQFYNTEMYKTQLFGIFMRGLSMPELADLIRRENIKEMWAAVSFANSVIRGTELTNITRNFTRQQGAQETSIAKEAQNMTKYKRNDRTNNLTDYEEYSPVNAFQKTGFSPNNQRRPDKFRPASSPRPNNRSSRSPTPSECFLCLRPGHWKKDCPLRSKLRPGSKENSPAPRPDAATANYITIKRTPAMDRSIKKKQRAREAMQKTNNVDICWHPEGESDASGDELIEQITESEAEEVNALGNASESEDDTLERLTELVNNLSKKKVRFRKNDKKPFKSNKISSEQRMEMPLVHINGMKPVLADSGCDVSIWRPCDLPPNAEIHGINESIIGFDGRPVQVKTRAEIWLKQTSSGLEISNEYNGHKINALITDKIDISMLGYNDIAKMKIVLNKQAPLQLCTDTKVQYEYDVSSGGETEAVNDVEIEIKHKSNIELWNQAYDIESADEDLPTNTPTVLTADQLTNEILSTRMTSCTPFRACEALREKEGLVEIKQEWVYTVKKRDIANLGSILPFAKLRLYDSPMGPIDKGLNICTLIDTGSSISLLNEDILKKTDFNFEKLPNNASAKSFCGGVIEITGKIRTFVCFGNKIRKQIDFHLFKAESNYDAVLSFPTMCQLGIELHAADNCFKLDGIFHPIYRYDLVNEINNIEEKSLNLKSIPITVYKGLSLRKGDEYFCTFLCNMDEGAEADVGDLFYLDYPQHFHDKGLRVADRIVEIQKLKVKKRVLATMVFIRLEKDASVDILDLTTGQDFGFLRPLVTSEYAEVADKVEDVREISECCFIENEADALELHKQQEQKYKELERLYREKSDDELATYLSKNSKADLKCIIFYLKRREMSEEETIAMENGKKDRLKFWDRQTIRKEFKETLENIDLKYRQDVEDILYEQWATFSGKSTDLQYGAKNYIIDALYPNSLSMYVPSRPTQGLHRHILRRLQLIMERAKMVEKMDDTPACTHHFLAIKRPKTTHPTDLDALNSLTDEECEKKWRCVIDSSVLTPLCYRAQNADPPTIWGALGRIEQSSIRSIGDVSRAFDQILISARARRLFCFESAIPSMPILALCRLPQGQSESARYCQYVMADAVETPCAIPSSLSFEEFVAAHEELREKQRREDVERREKEIKRATDQSESRDWKEQSTNQQAGSSKTEGELAMECVTENGKNEHENDKINKNKDVLSDSVFMYVDDVSMSSCGTIERFNELNIPNEALYKAPTTDQDKLVYFHLALLRRVLFCFGYNNILMSPRKLFIMCQNRPHKFLGLQFERDVVTIPEKTKETLRNLPMPKTLKMIQRFLGYVQYYCSIVTHVRVYTFFMSLKLRLTSGKFSWDEKDTEQYKELIEIICEAHKEGFVKAICPNIRRKQLIVSSDWAKMYNVSSLTVLVKFEENGITHCLPAIADSRCLAQSLAKAGSTTGELGSLCYGLINLRTIIQFLPITVWTDNLSLVFLLQKRFQCKVAIDSSVVLRLLLAINNFHFLVRFCPTELQMADYLSRVKQETNTTVDDFLTKSEKIEDFEFIDQILRPERQTETNADFIKRANKNIELVRKLETMRGDNYDELLSYFTTTHSTANDIRSALQDTTNSPIVDSVESKGEESFQAEVGSAREASTQSFSLEGMQRENRDERRLRSTITRRKTNERSACMENESGKVVNSRYEANFIQDKINDHPKVKEDIIDENNSEMINLIDIYQQKPEIPEIQSEHFDALPVFNLEQETTRIPLDEAPEVEYGSKDDWIDFVLGPNSNSKSSLTRQQQEKNRRDTLMISKYPDLVAVLINGSQEGILDEEISESYMETSDFLAEINFLRHHLKNEGDIEPLFSSYDQAKKHLNTGRLCDELEKNRKWYEHIQAREPNLRIIKALIEGKISWEDQAIDALRKVDRMARVLLNDFGSVLLFSGILFRVSLVAKGQKQRCAVIVNKVDAQRQCVLTHNRDHRGSIWLYTVISHRLYTLNLYKICVDTVKQCSHCSAFFQNRRKIRSNLQALVDVENLSTFYLDLKGPLIRNNQRKDRESKAYILVLFNPVTFFHSFHFLPDKSAKTVLRVLFFEFFKVHTGVNRLIMDLGSEFQNSLIFHLKNLLRLDVRFVCKSNAKANEAEKSNNRLGKCLRTILRGKECDWKEKLVYVQQIINSCYIHEVVGKTSAHLHGWTDGSSNFYTPSIVTDDPDAHYMGEHWNKATEGLREVANIFREKYGIFLTLKRSVISTFQSLGMKEGDTVFYRSYSRPSDVSHGLKTLYPSFSIAKIEKILSRCACIVKNERTGKRVLRHISDIQLFCMPSKWRFSTDWLENELTYLKERRGDDLMGDAREEHDVTQRVLDGAQQNFEKNDEEFRGNKESHTKVDDDQSKTAQETEQAVVRPKTRVKKNEDKLDVTRNERDSSESSDDELRPRRSPRLRQKPRFKYK